MEVIYVTSKSRPLVKRCILCLGIFDGVHLGHRSVIENGIREARAYKIPAAILTFFPHPANILNFKRPLKMISTLSQRLQLLDALGLDICFVIRFDKRFAGFSARKFVEEILIRLLNPQVLVVGKDFRFGAGSKGDVELLKKIARAFDFRLKIVDCYEKNGKKISSSLIRTLLQAGRIETANKFLGRLYTIEGKVVSGNRLGTDIGFPTANIDCDKDIILPLGIFSGLLAVEGKIHRAVIYIGFKPMFKKRSSCAEIEAHIFNFKKKIYSKKVSISLFRKIRDERKFNTFDELKEAIKKDVKMAKKDLNSLNCL